MAGVNDAQVQGLDNVIQAINDLSENLTPFYSVWRGAVLSFPWNNDDKEEGLSYLRSNLEAFARDGNRDVLSIRWHPEQAKGYITKDTPVIASLFFRVCKHDPGAVRQEWNARYSGNDEIKNAIAELKNSMDSRFAALEGEEVEQDPADKTIGAITSLMDHPVIGTLLQRLADRWIPPAQGSAQFAPRAISGAPQPPAQPVVPTQEDVDKVNSALERIWAVDPQLPDDLLRLADIAENKKGTFEMLISMLRKM